MSSGMIVSVQKHIVPWLNRKIVQRHCIEYAQVAGHFELNEIFFSSDPTTMNYEYFEVLILNW